MDFDVPASKASDVHLNAIAITIEKSWSREESACFGDPLLDNLAHYARHDTGGAEVLIAKARRRGDLIGVAPLLVIHRYQTTRLLAAPYRLLLNPPFGPLARMTICVVDTTFLGYRNTDPIVARDPDCTEEIRDALFQRLKSDPEYDAIMLSMPENGREWMRDNGFRVFPRIPLTKINLSRFESFDAYVASLSKSGRRNVSRDGRKFKDASVSLHAPPLDAELASRLHDCLDMSATRNAAKLEVPFNDLMNSRSAFLGQHQWAIVAAVGDRIAGFFSFLRHNDTMHQVHGGLDYDVALDIKAYPNLLNAAVRHAIECGCRTLTLGPMNNQAKARIAESDPVVAGFWPRTLWAALLLNPFVIRKLQIHDGPAQRTGSRA